MAFRKQKQRILSGGLNLVAPADKINEPDSPILHNWRVDQAGQLRSRRGLVADATGLGGAVHSLFRVGNDRYAGVGSSLRRGPALATTLATGFSSTGPIGITAYQDFVWVMDREKQGKVDRYGNFRNWLPAPPASAPTVAAGAEVKIVEATFDQGAASWGVVRYHDGTFTINPPGVLNYDPSNKISGTHSLHLALNPAGRWQARLDSVNLDFRVDGEARDDDQLRIWIYCSNPQAIESLFIVLASGVAEPKQIVQAEINPAVLNPTAYSWTEVRVLRRLDPGAIALSDPQYAALLDRITTARDRGDSVLEQALVQEREATYQSLVSRSPYFYDSGINGPFNWASVSSMVIEATITEACDIHLDEARMVGGPDGSLQGEYSYFVTYDTDDGHESLAGPESNYVTVNKLKVNMSNIPVSPDPQVTVKHIYRYGGPLDTPTRVASLLNAQTGWVDEVSNDQAQVGNIRLRIDADPAPPAAGLLGPHDGRLIAWSSAAHPSRLWYTHPSRPWHWPGSDDAVEGNWDDVGEDYEELLTVTSHNAQLWCYKQRSIWKYSGDLAEALPRRTLAQVGAVGRRAVVPAGGYDYFVGPEGVYVFNGERERKISQAIDPIFKGDWVNVGASYVPPIDADNAGATVLGYVNGRLYVCYPESGQSAPTRTLVFDEETGRWSTSSQAFTALFNEGQGGGWMGGTTAGALYQVESGSTDAGAAIPVRWQSAFLDQGLPDNLKMYGDLVIEFQTGVGSETPSTLTVKMLTDNGATELSLGSISGGTRQTATFRLNGGAGAEARNGAILIEGDATSTCIIYAVYLHWYALERVGQTFDSGVIDLGTEVLKQVDRIEADVTAAAQVNWRSWSDVPGNLLVARESGNFGATGGRKTQTVIIRTGGGVDTITEGRRLRYVLDSPGAMQIHALRLRVRLVPEYFDGAAGEFYSSTRLNFEGRINEAKQMELDYDLPSGGALEVWAVVPGGTWARVRDIELPATSGRTRHTVGFDTGGSPAVGEQMEFRLVSPGAGRIWGAAVWVRPVGTYVPLGEIWESGVWAPLGHQTITAGREIEIDCDTDGARTLEIHTERMSGGLELQQSGPVNTESLTPGRATVRVRVPAFCQGRLWRLVMPAGAAIRIYGMRMYAHGLRGPDWQWLQVPGITPTPTDWTRVPLPLRSADNQLPAGADDQWRWIALPVDAIE